MAFMGRTLLSNKNERYLKELSWRDDYDVPPDDRRNPL
jgi:hypothetical protein